SSSPRGGFRRGHRLCRQTFHARSRRMGRGTFHRTQRPWAGRCAPLPRRPHRASRSSPRPLLIRTRTDNSPQEDTMSRIARPTPSRRSMLYAGFGVFALPTALSACGTTEEGADPAAPVDGEGGGGDASGAVVTV